MTDPLPGIRRRKPKAGFHIDGAPGGWQRLASLNRLAARHRRGEADAALPRGVRCVGDASERARPTIASRTSTPPIFRPFGVGVQREPTPRAHLRAAAANAAQPSGGPRSSGSGCVPTTHLGTGSLVTSKPTLQPSDSGSGVRAAEGGTRSDRDRAVAQDRQAPQSHGRPDAVVHERFASFPVEGAEANPARCGPEYLGLTSSRVSRNTGSRWLARTPTTPSPCTRRGTRARTRKRRMGPSAPRHGSRGCSRTRRGFFRMDGAPARGVGPDGMRGRACSDAGSPVARPPRDA
jgi:hypothetical protein